MTFLIFLLSFVPLYWAVKIIKLALTKDNLLWVISAAFMAASGLILFIAPVLVWTGVLK